jgi:hypothetical protein
MHTAATQAPRIAFFIRLSTHFREPCARNRENPGAEFENYGGGFIEHFKLSGHESFSKPKCYP